MNSLRRVAVGSVLALLILPGVSFAQSVSSATSIQAQIAALEAQLAVLQQQLAQSQGGTVWCHLFNSNLYFGISNTEVSALQEALAKDGESVNITGTFDEQTAAGVVAFQEKYKSDVLTPIGLKNGTGYVGPATQAKLNKLFGCTTTTPPVICPAFGCGTLPPIINPGPVTLPPSVPPTVNVSVTPATRTATVSQGAYTTVYFNFASDNYQTVNWTAQASQSWIAVPASGAAQGSESVGVLLNGQGSLTPGTYTGSITFSQAPAGGKAFTSQTVNITLTVTGATSASLQLTAPLAGTVWQAGGSYPITWTSSGFSGTTPLQILIYDTRYGQSYDVFGLGSIITTTGAGSYTVKPPSNAAVGSTYVVQIHDVTSPLGIITSQSGSFSVAAATTQTPQVGQVQSFAADITESNVILSWQAATATAGVGVYNIYRSTTLGCSATTANLIAQKNVLTYTDSNVPAGTYYYCVAAQDVNGVIGPVSSQIEYGNNYTPSTISITLDSANPIATQVSTGATGVSLLAFDITNPLADSVNISSLMLTEQLQSAGQLVGSQFSNVKLYDTTSGSNVLVGTFPSFSSALSVLGITDSIMYPVPAISIPANSTHKFLVTGSVAIYAANSAAVGTSGNFYVVGSSPTSISILDAKTNVIEPASGSATGNLLTIVRGQ